MDPKRYYKTKTVWFQGLCKRIVLQSENGPCPLIAICNHLILRGELTLQKEVSNHSLCHSVYDKLFSKLKDHEVVSMKEEVMKLDKGLNMNVMFQSTKEFEASNSFKMFQILGIQLYHGWLLHPQEDEHVIKAIGSRSHDQVVLDLELYNCSMEDVHSSDPGIMDHQQYSIANTFITGYQMTNFGLSCLQNDMADDELAVLFQEKHFSTIFKHNRNVCSLVTDEGLATFHTWQRLSVKGGGAFMSPGWGSTIPSNRGLDMSKFDKRLPSNKQGPKSSTRHHQGLHFGRSQQQSPIPAKAYDLGSKSKNAFLLRTEPHYSPANVEPKSESAGSSSSSSTSGRTAPSGSQGKQYAALFTQEKDKELGRKFHAFLEGFKAKNGMPYYKGAVAAMDVHRVAEIYVQYGHIKHHDPKLAYSICCCFSRIREHLNEAAGEFARGFTEFDFKFVGNPTVHISDLPEPRRWMKFKKFLSLPGNEPAENYDIYCGDVSLAVVRSTLIGRVSFSNLLVKVARTHNSGYSWDGDFTPDDVMIDENLEIDIQAKLIHNSKASAQQKDFARCADVIEYCGVDGRMPGFFNHLRSSLKSFIPLDLYSHTMVRKYQRFITTHMALKPPMANIKVFDDVYAMHQALSPWAKRLLQAVLNDQILSDDWRSIFIGGQIPENVPNILKRVYGFNKQGSGSGSGSGSGQASAEGAKPEVTDDTAKPEPLGGEVSNDAAQLKPRSSEVGNDGANHSEVTDDSAKPHELEGAKPYSDEVTDDTAKPEPHGHELSNDAAQLKPRSSEVGNDGANHSEVTEPHGQAAAEPFEDNIEGMMVCTRHVRQHGTAWSKVKGKQSLRKLSEIEMVISHFLGFYPAVMEQLICGLHIAGVHDPLALEELEEMLSEILEDYNRPESRYLQFIDEVQQIGCYMKKQTRMIAKDVGSFASSGSGILTKHYVRCHRIAFHLFCIIQICTQFLFVVSGFAP